MAKQKSRTRVSPKNSGNRSRKRKPKRKAPETTAIVPVQQAIRRREISKSDVDLITRTVAKDCSADELALFLWVAKKHKLDPMTRQLHAVKRGGVMCIQIGIDGYRSMAARYPDYGGIDEPEYEFVGSDKKVPTMARIRVWKKGFEHPTVGIAYMDEYRPSGPMAFMWEKMPKLMLAKCAEALALRKAYPDLADIYTDEEMHQADVDFTSSGRQIVDDKGFSPSGRAVTYAAQHGSHEAAQRVLQEKLASGKPGPIDPEIMPQEPPAKQPGSSKRTSGKIPESEYRKENVPPATPTEPWKYVGTVTIDYSQDKTFPRIFGDIADLAAHFPKDLTLKRKDDFWHAFQEDAERIKQVAVEKNFKIEEILPQKPSGVPPKQRHDDPGTSRRKGQRAGSSGPLAPVLMKGMIEQANPESGKSPRVSVLFKVEKVKYWMSAFDTALFPPLISGKGKAAELYIKESAKGDKTYKNIVGLKRVGATEYDEDGKTPVVQRRDQEAGGKTLFGT